MSNIAGKSYAMNVITPIGRWRTYLNLLIFWLANTPMLASKFSGLLTLSLIHYARWVIIRPSQFPRLSEDQPKEDLHYSYMMFFSNFNGSWEQYVDSFHMAIPNGLDLMWQGNILYPKSVPLQPFHKYIVHNQIWTEHYYNAYPLAASNDVKAAMALKPELLDFIEASKNSSADTFKQQYDQFLAEVQPYLGRMEASPVVSAASEAVKEQRRLDLQYATTMK